jgi:LAO/AO transport system kinase
VQAGLDESFCRELVTAMEKTLHSNRIEELLRERSVGATIACQAARRIAEELNVPYSEVGRVANDLKIKIRECELGCF